MAKKYLQVDVAFRGAKRFESKKISHVPYGFGIQEKITPKHASIDISGRTVCPADTIPLHCMTNLVSVLMGDRPIPAKRTGSPVAIYDQSKYEDIARRCFVEVTSADCNQSTMTTNKAYYAHTTENTIATLELDGEEFKLNRSCPTHQIMSLAWNTPKYPDEYDKFDAFCMTVLGEDYKEKFNFLQTLTALRKLFVKGNKKVVKFLEAMEGHCTSGFDRDCIQIVRNKVVSDSAFRMENYSTGSTFGAWLACPPTHGSPEMATVMSGVIHMKLTEDEWKRLQAGPMFATLMDSGVITVPTTYSSWDDTYESLPTPFEPTK